MQRFSVSVDEELAEWIESQAAQRGISKAKVIRESVKTAKVTGLVQYDEDSKIEGDDLLNRIEELETRVAALETETAAPANHAEPGTAGVVSAFEAQLEGRPPETSHGKAATVRVFAMLLEDGPLRTKDLRERIYPEFDEQFSDSDSMWQSIQRYFDEIPGIKKIGHGEWDADPAQVDM